MTYLNLKETNINCTHKATLSICHSRFTWLEAHISVIYRIALLYFVVTAHELSAPWMLTYFPGFCNCLQDPLLPPSPPFPSPPPHPHLSLVRTSLGGLSLLMPADPQAASSILRSWLWSLTGLAVLSEVLLIAIWRQAAACWRAELRNSFFSGCPQPYKPAGEGRFSESVRVREERGWF